MRDEKNYGIFINKFRVEVPLPTPEELRQIDRRGAAVLGEDHPGQQHQGRLMSGHARKNRENVHASSDLAAAAVLLALASSAQAQSSWPNKPVKILVPTAPGGTADATARMFALHLGKALGQQFYVENRGGAGNTLGIESVARSPADGYTLLLGAGTITINHLVYKKLPYDVLRDLTPVTQMVSVANVLVVHPSQPMKTLADYIAAAKAKPGQINYGSAGVGSNLHLSMELLKVQTGIEVTHVPYKGVGPAMQDTLAGHVMSMVSNVAVGQAACRRRQAPRARGDVAASARRRCRTCRRCRRPASRTTRC